ncbi:MAG: hypothetical protein WD048_03330 [Chitinophagales bacterium]
MNKLILIILFNYILLSCSNKSKETIPIINNIKFNNLFYTYKIKKLDSVILFEGVLNYEKYKLRPSWLSLLHEILFYDFCFKTKYYNKFTYYQSKFYPIDDSNMVNSPFHMSISLKHCDIEKYDHFNDFKENILKYYIFTDYIIYERAPIESAAIEDIYSSLKNKPSNIDSIGILMEMYVVYQEKLLYNKAPDSTYYNKINQLKTNIENRGDNFNPLLNMINEIDSLIKNTQ